MPIETQILQTLSGQNEALSSANSMKTDQTQKKIILLRKYLYIVGVILPHTTQQQNSIMTISSNIDVKAGTD